MIYFYTNGHLAWLKIAKNACSSWSQVFSDMACNGRLVWVDQVAVIVTDKD